PALCWARMGGGCLSPPSGSAQSAMAFWEFHPRCPTRRWCRQGPHMPPGAGTRIGARRGLGPRLCILQMRLRGPRGTTQRWADGLRKRSSNDLRVRSSYVMDHPDWGVSRAPSPMASIGLATRPTKRAGLALREARLARDELATRAWAWY